MDHIRSDDDVSVVLWNVADATLYPISVLFNDTTNR